jgi:hypothetical protein
MEEFFALPQAQPRRDRVVGQAVVVDGRSIITKARGRHDAALADDVPGSSA